MSYQRNVTMIEDLPELDDLENSNQYQSRGESDKLNRYIREPMILPAEAGMSYQNSLERTTNVRPDLIRESRSSEWEERAPVRRNINEQYHPEPNCIDFARHVNDCPLCSRFYNNNYHTVFISIIVVLIIVILMLIKKILNV